MDPSQYLASTRIGRGIGTEFAYSGGARRMDDTAVSAGAPDWMKVNHVVVAESPSMAHADNSSRGFRPSIAERLQDIHGDDASRHRAPNPIGMFELSHGGERRHFTDSDGRGRALAGDWRVPPPNSNKIREAAKSFDAGYKMGWTGAMSDSFGVGLVHSGEAHTTSTAFSNKKADMPKLHAAKPSYEGAKQREYEFMMSLRHEIQVPQHKPKPIEDAPLTPRQVQAENLALRHQKLVHYGQRAAEHLDERHIAAKGRLLSNRSIRNIIKEKVPDQKASPIRPSTVDEKSTDASLWQPRALHLGRTHAQSDTTLRWMEGHSMEVLQVRMYKDFLFSASKDRSIRMFDLVTGETLHVFTGHTDWVMDLELCDKERRLLPKTQTGHPMILLSTSADRTVRFWDATTGECFKIMSRGHSEPITSITYSGSQVFTGSADCTVVRWNADIGKVTGRCFGHSGTVWNVHCAAQFVFSCSDDLSARQWDRDTLAQVRVFSGHTGSVLDLCCVVSGADGFDDAGLLCTVSEDGSLRLWRTGTDEEGGGECCAMARGFESAQKHGELSEQMESHGKKIVKQVHNRVIEGWQWMGALHSVVANNDGVIYAGSANGVICEYNLNQKTWEELPGTNGVLELIRNDYYHCKPKKTASGSSRGSSVYSMAVSDDGYLLAGCEDHCVHEFWVSNAGREENLLQGHRC